MIIKYNFLRSPSIYFDCSHLPFHLFPPCIVLLDSILLHRLCVYSTKQKSSRTWLTVIPVPGRSSITSTKFKGKIPDAPLSSPLAHSSFTYSLRIIVSPSEKLSSSLWSPIYSNRAMHLGPLHKQERNLLCIFPISGHIPNNTTTITLMLGYLSHFYIFSHI